MWTGFERRRLLAFGVLLMLFGRASAIEVTLDVHVTLVDENNAPIANAPVRLVFGSAPGWDAVGAGTTFTTDAKGEHHFTTTTSLDIQKMKAPADFFTQLVSAREKTRHLKLGAELPYRGQPQLYVVDINRFAGGANVGRAVMNAYGVDAKGRFTVPAGTAGARLAHFFLKPAEEPETQDARRWTVTLMLRREPEPVQR